MVFMVIGGSVPPLSSWFLGLVVFLYGTNALFELANEVTCGETGWDMSENQIPKMLVCKYPRLHVDESIFTIHRV